MIFEANDYKGRLVVLKQSTWDTHIKEDMKSRVEDIKNSVTRPFLVVRDMTTIATEDGEMIIPSENREELYGTCITNTYNLRFVKTVVDYKTTPGEIVTSYIVGKVKIDIRGGILYDSRQK